VANILVYALEYEGAINKNSLGAVSEGAKLAAELGGEAHAVIVGSSVSDEAAASVGEYGATKVFRVNGPDGLAQPVVDAMAQIVGSGDYGYVLFGGGLLGFEIGAGLAARLDAGVVMEVTAVRVEDGKLVAERPILGDTAISQVHYRSAVGIIIGQSVGDLAGPLPTCPCRTDVAVRQPGRGAHMPTECRAQFTGRLQMVGDQRGILVNRGRAMLLDGRRDLPVQLRAVRFQLRLVCHRADQRVPEGVLGSPESGHWIDEVGID